VVLVVEASRQAGSLAALVRGFRDHGPPRVRLAGVVLNRVASPRHRALLAEALAAIEVPLLGVLPPHPSLELPSRHLGLFPAHEVSDLGERGRAMASLAHRHLDLGRLLPLLEPPAGGGSAPDPLTELLGPPPAGAALPVAVAADAAFHFRYPEMGELLAAVKLDPIPWSPVANEPLPPGTRAVLLPGGYPELWAEQLAAADRSLADLRRAAGKGLPIVAECGGLLLLGQSLADPGGRLHAMAGLLPFEARPGRLSLGYRQLTACRDGMLVRSGEVMRGHEFHRWQLEGTPPESAWAAPGLWQLEGWGVPRSEEGWSATNLHASWIHLHWAGCPRIPRRLAAAAAKGTPSAGS
jgi:cobyrinic acid a,c-diamide synthase